MIRRKPLSSLSPPVPVQTGHGVEHSRSEHLPGFESHVPSPKLGMCPPVLRVRFNGGCTNVTGNRPSPEVLAP
jgi:hypothetical protein